MVRDKSLDDKSVAAMGWLRLKDKGGDKELTEYINFLIGIPTTTSKLGISLMQKIKTKDNKDYKAIFE